MTGSQNSETPEINAILWTAEEIQSRIEQLSSQISRDYADCVTRTGKPLLLIGLLKGAYIFLADLAREISLPSEIDFVRIASYGTTTNPGEIQFLQDLEVDIENRDVIIVEDIVDTGNTLEFFVDELERRKPSSIKTCALINKTYRRATEIELSYIGFEVEDDAFLIGYGLDYAERFRELPYIATLNPDAIK